MKQNGFLIVFLILVSGWVTACAVIPTSHRADQARARMQPTIEYQLKSAKVQPYSNLHLVAYKKEKILEAWFEDPETRALTLYKSWPVCKYSGTLGPKFREGDLQTPEGFYSVTAERLNPNSKYYLAMNIGFPNAYDRAQGRTGSHLMVHGGCVSEGCLAMGDAQIEEIYMLAERALRRGQPQVPVDIYPFRMTQANLALHQASPHLPFWTKLKAVHDGFEARKVNSPTQLEQFVSRVMGSF